METMCWPGLGMMLMLVLLWATLIAALVFFIRWLVLAGHSRRHKRSARGESSKEACADMRHVLQEKD
jgi:uncharacterized membrane protein